MKEINPQNTTRAYAWDMWLKALNPMVTFSAGEISSCDIPFSDDLRQFNDDYLPYRAGCRALCQ